ncbi:hypothetical protein pdam_00010385 [Pocillopora damicornis]|uniref:Uncharacterized protein n=1 Tax=Pocillopora damicornis TaxID=46731 RepID=A0A3M6UQT6_POCDA|nr:hypothetical protein pdam_00010385 [Pocillopora damicornis]
MFTATCVTFPVVSKHVQLSAFKILNLVHYLLSYIKPGRFFGIQDRAYLKARIWEFKYCAGMKVILEAKLSIYQKSSMAYKVTWFKTTASTEMLNGVEKPPASLRIIPIRCS